MIQSLKHRNYGPSPGVDCQDSPRGFIAQSQGTADGYVCSIVATMVVHIWSGCAPLSQSLLTYRHDSCLSRVECLGPLSKRTLVSTSSSYFYNPMARHKR
jgi:hypothetical protein